MKYVCEKNRQESLCEVYALVGGIGNNKHNEEVDCVVFLERDTCYEKKYSIKGK